MISIEPRDISRNGTTKAIVDVFNGDERKFTDSVTADSAISREKFARRAAKAVGGDGSTAMQQDAIAASIDDELQKLIDMPLPESPNNQLEDDDDRRNRPAATRDATAGVDERDAASGKLILSPKRTLPTAEAYIEEFHHHAEGRTIHFYFGVLHAWLNNSYSEIEDASVKHRLQRWLHDSLQYRQTKDGGLELIPFNANAQTENSALEAIRAYSYLPSSITPAAWLDGRKEPDPQELLPTPSGSLHVPSGRMYPPTPLLFNINAINFDYDPKAVPPERWTKYLEQLWGDDLEQVNALQEWMGLFLISETRYQKMLLIVGPRRSGKGTLARVLTQLVGAGNVAGPTTSSLAGPFGLQPLIGKSLAIVSDARFAGENIGIVVERLLCVSGEDTLTIDRKFQSSVTAKLATRFMFLSNELPKMTDASGALAGRFIILRLTESFYGKEDTGLTAALLDELPGILLWAIEGLRRLRARGCLVQPSSVADAISEMEDLASPIGAFVRDCCDVKQGNSSAVQELFEAWKFWCKDQNREHAGTTATFGRDLRAAVAGIKTAQAREDGTRIRTYEGIALKGDVKNAILATKMADSAHRGGTNG